VHVEAAGPCDFNRVPVICDGGSQAKLGNGKYACLPEITFA
jgi:hypothetical protein